MPYESSILTGMSSRDPSRELSISGVPRGEGEEGIRLAHQDCRTIKMPHVKGVNPHVKRLPNLNIFFKGPSGEEIPLRGSKGIRRAWTDNDGRVSLTPLDFDVGVPSRALTSPRMPSQAVETAVIRWKMQHLNRKR